MKIIYTIGDATEQDIYEHFMSCSNNFVPPLTQNVSLLEYAKKIKENAVSFEAWSDDLLVGLVACYFNDLNKNLGFITNVSTLEGFLGRGIASELISHCVNFGIENMFNEIRLQVFHKNITAIRLYERFNFSVINQSDDLIIMKRKI